MKLLWKKNHIFWKMRQEIKRFRKKSKYWKRKCGEKDQEKEQELATQKDSYEGKLKKVNRKVDKKIDRYNSKNQKISDKELEWDKAIVGLMNFIADIKSEFLEKQQFTDDALRSANETKNKMTLVKKGILEVGNIENRIMKYVSENGEKLLRRVK